MQIKSIKINFPFFYAICFYLIFISNIFIPPFDIGLGIYFRFVDIFVPLSLLLIIIDKNRIIPKSFIFFIVFALWIAICLIVNHSNVSYNDFFEFYKIIKFIIITIITISYFKYFPHHFNLFIQITFILLLIINLFQYFNIFHFHDLIVPYYDPSLLHWSTFGKNSLGQPGPKRMLGTAGNPNNNALIFLFYFCWFLWSMFDEKIKKIKYFQWIFLFLSITAIILCQSRTALVIIIVIPIIYFIFYHKPIKYLICILLGTAFIFFILSITNKYSIIYFSDFFKNIVESGENIVSTNQSVRGRLDVWKFLIDMWKEKPIFGYGPYKNFFYSYTIYSENEYILYLWRYGIIGIILYIFWYLFPIIKYENKKFKIFITQFYLLFGLSMMIAAITNNPISHPMISTLLAIAMGHHFALRKAPF